MKQSSVRRIAVLALAGFGLVAAGGFYATRGASGNSGACTLSRQTAERLKPLASGELAALQILDDPAPAPNLVFFADGGAPHKLAEFKGKTVLVNLWATWCIPCRQEMPALDALETTLGNERFEVVAVNIDSRDTAKPQAWLKEVGVKTLAYYADPSGKVFQDLKLVGRGFGLPTTVLVDPQRCEIGTAAGPAEWGSQDGIALVRAALGG